MTICPTAEAVRVTPCHSNEAWTNRTGSRERWTERRRVKGERGREICSLTCYNELNLLCLLGGLPGRKKLFSGWCGGLSQHFLSLPFWVSGLNDWNWFPRNRAFLIWSLHHDFSNLVGWVRSVTPNWQLTITVSRKDQASKPPGLQPGWRTHRHRIYWKTCEILTRNCSCNM